MTHHVVPLALAMLATGCVHMPETHEPILRPSLVEGQPIVITGDHDDVHTVEDEKPCRYLDEGTKGREKCLRDHREHVGEHWYTAKYGSHEVTQGDLLAMSAEYEDTVRNYDSTRSKCGLARVPYVLASAFAIGGGVAYFLGPDNGLDGTNRYIAVGAALGAAAISYGVGKLLERGNCDEAKAHAEHLDDMRVLRGSGDDATRLRDPSAISGSVPDLVKQFNARHAAAATASSSAESAAASSAP